MRLSTLSVAPCRFSSTDYKFTRGSADRSLPRCQDSPLKKLCNARASECVRRAPESSEARYRHLWQKPEVSIMRGADKSAREAARTGAVLFFCCSRIRLFIVLIIGGLTIALGETARPPNAFVYIISPKDGDTVTSPFHQHLLIDVNEVLDPNEPIPQDKHHLHFGAGKTEALIELPPGKHTLQLGACLRNRGFCWRGLGESDSACA